VLTRRGISDAEEAAAFLAAGESHDPFEFDGMEEAAGLVLEALRAERKITVYGDFDCDGVCATAILVGCLRELGGECDWFIPDRIKEGYGLNPDAIREIVGRGTELLITVDCGVTAVEEVALAREAGLDVIVTDHHQSGPVLPDCPVIHPELGGYPCPSLCGAAVAAKLASAARRLAGAEPDQDEADLDLVALATVADVMPLTGENRQLVRSGLEVGRRAGRVGLAALMKEARVEPSRLTSEDFGFRLAPRINAAGRLLRADAGVELFLATSRERATEVARELSMLNAERRRIEREVEAAARAELKALGDERPAAVVAGAGWHPGVVGIVASKLARGSGRPAVVIALDGETGRGSARSVPGLDLHSALAETAGLLESFGGHEAAAGLTIKTARINDFREELSRIVEARIGSDPVEPVLEHDAIVAGSLIGLDLAEELEQLQPFGNANPSVSLLVPAARIENLQTIGDGKHCRFTVCSGGHRAGAVAFGRSSLGDTENQVLDLVAELGVNHWNGAIEPQLRVTGARVVPPATGLAECDQEEWWARFDRATDELKSEREPTPAASRAGASPQSELVAAPSGPPGAALAELIGSGERILALAADARQRWTVFNGQALERFLPEGVAESRPGAAGLGLWAGSPAELAERAGDSPLVLGDWASLEGPFALDPGGFDRLALIDPPYTAAQSSRLAACGRPLHLLAGADEIRFTSQYATHRLDLTGQLRVLFRGLRDAAGEGQEICGAPLRRLLAADGKTTRSPEEAAVLLEVLVEIGLARSEGINDARSAGVVSSEQVDLSDSAVFRNYLELFKEKDRFINQFNNRSQTLRGGNPARSPMARPHRSPARPTHPG